MLGIVADNPLYIPDPNRYIVELLEPPLLHSICFTSTPLHTTTTTLPDRGVE